MKRILKQYGFSLVIILCAGAFLSGIASVREKTRYNMDMTPYETVEIENTDEGVLLHYGENERLIRTNYAQMLAKKLNDAFNEDLLFDFRQIFD